MAQPQVQQRKEKVDLEKLKKQQQDPRHNQW